MQFPHAPASRQKTTRSWPKTRSEVIDNVSPSASTIKLSHPFISWKETWGYNTPTSTPAKASSMMSENNWCDARRCWVVALAMKKRRERQKPAGWMSRSVFAQSGRTGMSLTQGLGNWCSCRSSHNSTKSSVQIAWSSSRLNFPATTSMKNCKSEQSQRMSRIMRFRLEIQSRVKEREREVLHLLGWPRAGTKNQCFQRKPLRPKRVQRMHSNHQEQVKLHCQISQIFAMKADVIQLSH